jgi:hypothetical protein
LELELFLTILIEESENLKAVTSIETKVNLVYCMRTDEASYSDYRVHSTFSLKLSFDSTREGFSNTLYLITELDDLIFIHSNIVLGISPVILGME